MHKGESIQFVTIKRWSLWTKAGLAETFPQWVCQYKGYFQAPLVVFLHHYNHGLLISQGFLFWFLGRDLEETHQRVHWISLWTLHSLVCAEESDCPVAVHPAHKWWLEVPCIIFTFFKNEELPKMWDTATITDRIMSCDLMLPRDTLIKCDYVLHRNSANIFLSLNSGSR